MQCGATARSFNSASPSPRLWRPEGRGFRLRRSAMRCVVERRSKRRRCWGGHSASKVLSRRGSSLAVSWASRRPTSNSATSFRPRLEVYATRTRLADGRKLPGVANIGVNPTTGTVAARMEVHLFDFDEDIYGETIETELIAFQRPRGPVRFFTKPWSIKSGVTRRSLAASWEGDSAARRSRSPRASMRATRAASSGPSRSASRHCSSSAGSSPPGPPCRRLRSRAHNGGRPRPGPHQIRRKGCGRAAARNSPWHRGCSATSPGRPAAVRAPACTARMPMTPTPAVHGGDDRPAGGGFGEAAHAAGADPAGWPSTARRPAGRLGQRVRIAARHADARDAPGADAALGLQPLHRRHDAVRVGRPLVANWSRRSWLRA